MEPQDKGAGVCAPPPRRPKKAAGINDPIFSDVI
jgi:hypothetical protein